jgi:hypothetical protein
MQTAELDILQQRNVIATDPRKEQLLRLDPDMWPIFLNYRKPNTVSFLFTAYNWRSLLIVEGIGGHLRTHTIGHKLLEEATDG